ncbi:predicted protein [Sclerotinia sclerotiorum 1980 UF-70]|uniref:Uncharacterized protein n=1 Tax=Sclerotinia sclerotiorum (strain ATCC 18683 / 1980 / Ss-1) TaxID=665079 RepID=A7ETZ7_SCLS1|nr:predicted protein [Sclerotinia sclerotiorum 1980 UF-70]EDN92939.1 predicted protein [Sclerotinia sclerotiorum 1980 UF-70]
MSPTDENAAMVKRKPNEQNYTANPKISRSVKARPKYFDVQVEEDGWVGIRLHEKLVANCQIFKYVLGWIQAWASKLQRETRRANLVHYATDRLEDLISQENHTQRVKCRFCEGLSTCPLQSHNVTSEQATPEMKSTENSNEKRFEDVSRDQFNANKLFEVDWRGAETPI